MARPRKPTGLKVIQGTLRPCRANPNEPALPREIPAPPAHLGDRAKVAWGAVSVILDRMGLLTGADGLALEGLCATYAELVEARLALQDRGATSYVSETEGGSVMHRPYPEVAMVADLDRRFRGWLMSFGLTPADRSKVSATSEEKPENPFAQFRRA